MHSKAWHGQIWQTLKQNALHVEEDAVTHLQRVMKFQTFRLPGEQKAFSSFCKVVFSVPSHNSLCPSSPLCFIAVQRRRTPNFHSVICALGVLSLNFSTLIKSSQSKDKRTENIRQSLHKGICPAGFGWRWGCSGPSQKDLVQNKHWH